MEELGPCPTIFYGTEISRECIIEYYKTELMKNKYQDEEILDEDLEDFIANTADCNNFAIDVYSYSYPFYCPDYKNKKNWRYFICCAPMLYIDAGEITIPVLTEKDREVFKEMCRKCKIEEQEPKLMFHF